MTDATRHNLRPVTSVHWTCIAVACWLFGSGCATLPYRYGHFHAATDEPQNEVAFEYGRPQKTLDGLAWFMGLWSRLLPLNSHINTHELSECTKGKLIAYLEDNDLTDVLVRVNQYDPKGEWRRLRENHRISGGWRYTVGVLSLAQYTVMPGRVFGGDQYNAYTNTLYINSDVPAVVLHEAAYAKDIHSRSFPGSYAFASEIPLLSLWRHTRGVNDVLGYTQTNNDWLVERETYRVVYPQMGVRSTTMTGPILPFWDGILLSVAGAAVGHATGQVAISQRCKQRRLCGEQSTSEPGSEQLEPKQTTDDVEFAIGHTRLPVGTLQMTNHETESADEKRP